MNLKPLAACLLATALASAAALDTSDRRGNKLTLETRPGGYLLSARDSRRHLAVDLTLGPTRARRLRALYRQARQLAPTLPLDGKLRRVGAVGGVAVAASNQRGRCEVELDLQQAGRHIPFSVLLETEKNNQQAFEALLLLIPPDR